MNGMQVLQGGLQLHEIGRGATNTDINVQGLERDSVSHGRITTHDNKVHVVRDQSSQ